MNRKIMSILLALVLFAGAGVGAQASSASEIKKKQQEAESQLNAINKSISAMQAERSKIQSEITSLNAELVDTMLTLEVLKVDLENKQAEIDQAEIDLKAAQEKEESQYQNMKLRIQYMYEEGNYSYAALLLEADNISDFLNKADFVQDMYTYDRDLLTEYEQTRQEVADLKQTLEEEQYEMLDLQASYEEQETKLNSQIATAKNEVADFDSQLANAQSKAAEYQKTIKTQMAAIKKLEAQAAAAAAAAGTTTSEGGTTSGTGSNSSSGSSSSSATVSGGSGTGASIANYAVQFVGNPYVSGGTSLTNGADCSGFTWAVYQHFGISIPRVSYSQAGGGSSVSIGDVQPGDIIYYGGHVAIYIGGGKIVHASTAATGIKISSYTYRTPISIRRYW